jgi:uncharacterized membrane protein YkvA (DUF1232 family)
MKKSNTRYKAEEKKEFYKRIRKKIDKWAEKKGYKSKHISYIILAPDLFHLLCRLVLDKHVPVKYKAMLVATIAYFMSPLDVFPEGIFGPIGFLDDIILVAYVLDRLINHVDEEILMRHWVGDAELLEVIKEILALVDVVLGSKTWNKVKSVAIGSL